MGMRAHYVTKAGGQWELRYSHWGARTLDRDVFWGSEHTRRFIAAQALSGPDGWMDEVWCEAAVLVDDDRRLLLLFCGEVSGLVPHRRVLLAMLRANWPGWEVCWAHEGIGDIVAALGIDRRQVWADSHCEPVEPGWESCAPPPDSLPMAAVTLVRGGRIDAFAVDGLAQDLVAAGPERLLAAGTGTAVGLDDLPVCGLHVDGDRRVLHLWMAEAHRLGERALSAWSGWTIEWLGDRFETHVELAGGALTIQPPPPETVLAEVRGHLLAENDTDPAELRARLASSVGPGVTFTPSFDAHVVVRPTKAERQAIVERAIASLADTADTAGPG